MLDEVPPEMPWRWDAFLICQVHIKRFYPQVAEAAEDVMEFYRSSMLSHQAMGWYVFPHRFHKDGILWTCFKTIYNACSMVLARSFKSWVHVWGPKFWHIRGQNISKDCTIRCLWHPMGLWILDFNNFCPMYISCICWCFRKMPVFVDERWTL